MKYRLLIFLMVLSRFAAAQVDKPVVNFDVSHTNLGKVSNSEILLSLFTFRNTGTGDLVILRTEQDDRINIKLPQRAIPPGDTGSIQVYFRPDRKGRFDEKITIYTNASDKPAILNLHGTVQSLNSSPQDCYSFVLDNNNQVKNPFFQGTVINKETKLPIPVAKVYIYSEGQLVGTAITLNGEFSVALNNGLYDLSASSEGYDTATKNEYYFNKNSERIIFELSQRKSKADTTVVPVVVKEERPKDTSVVVVVDPPKDTVVSRNKPGLLSYDDYRPNNIVFLIDVSNSMQGHDRLPLLKISIKKMISQLRDIDRITVITYADKPKVMVQTTSADLKSDIYRGIDTLRAGGGTSGSRGLDMAYEMAKHGYILEANNQVILATDGAFEVKPRDRRTIRKYALGFGKRITLTTVGFGTQRTSLKVLEELSSKGGGHYIYIPNAAVAETAILDEIKNNSKKN